MIYGRSDAIIDITSPPVTFGESTNGNTTRSPITVNTAGRYIACKWYTAQYGFGDNWLGFLIVSESEFRTTVGNFSHNKLQTRTFTYNNTTYYYDSMGANPTYGNPGDYTNPLNLPVYTGPPYWFNASTGNIINQEAANLIGQFLQLSTTPTSGIVPSVSISLNKYFWYYTGSVIEPTITVTNISSSEVLTQGTDYSVAFSNNINVGTATIVITGGGDYSGSETVYFYIGESVDPLSPGGTTTTGGGTGDFDNDTDTISEPALPTLSSLYSKFTTLWVPTASEMQAFADWFFSTDFLDSQFYFKTFANPIDFVLGLSIIPVDVSYTQSNVVIGLIDSEISMRRALVQYVTVDCGTVNINEYWGAYLDYAPYTKIDVFLPYIGFRTLDTDTVMGSAVNIKYHCDILSGACIAFIIVDGTVAYEFSGNIALQIPISSSDYTNVIKTVASIAAVGISAIAAGAGAASGVSGSFLPIETKILTVEKEAGKALAAGAASNAGSVISTKQHVNKSGSISGETGLLGNKKPFLVINRPRQAVAVEQNTYAGYPVFITSQLSNLVGFTIVSDIHIENSFCTQNELIELERILKSGFII